MDIYNTFIKNGMGKSFNVAQKEFSSSEFKHPIFDSILGFITSGVDKDNELFLNEYQLKFNDTVFSLKTKIDYIVGSGNHTNSHIINSNGYLYQAPFTFYTQDSILDFPPGFEYGNNSRCVEENFNSKRYICCLNNFPHFNLGSENKFEKIPTGIDCERCHGQEVYM